MEASLFICPICYHDFDSAGRTPRVIPSCGHTICSECLTKMKNNPNINTHKCPFDQASLPRSIDACPKNFSLVRIIEERARVEKCEIHNHKPVNYLCLTEKKRICSLCCMEHQKKQHDVALIEIIESQYVEGIKQIHDFLEDVMTFHKNLILKLQENHQSQVTCIKNQYKNLRAFIDQKEEAMVLESKYCLDIKKSKLESILGETSQIFTKFSKQKAELGNILTKKDFSTENFSQEIVTEIQNYKEKMDYKNIVPEETEVDLEPIYFEKLMTIIIENLKKSLNNTKVPYLRDNFDKIMAIFPDKERKEEGNIPGQEGDLSAFRIKSNLMIEYSERILTIKKNEQDFCDIIVDFEKWKILDKMRLDLGDIKNEDLQLLSSIWERSVPSTLEIILRPETLTDNSQETLLLNILPKFKLLKELSLNMVEADPSLGKTLKNADFNNLEALSLNLTETNINDKDLLPLLGKLQNLKRFALYISETEITDKTLKKCGQSTFASSPLLEEITLHAEGVQITDKGVESFLSNLKNLKKLDLNFCGTSITNKTVYLLSQTLSKSPMIEHFGVCLKHTEVNDLDSRELFKDLPNIKTFVLNLDHTDVGDRTLQILTRNILMCARKMESLSLYLRETCVTDHEVIELFENIPDVKELILDFNSTKVTENSIKLFLMRKLPLFTKLNHLEIDLWKTNVSEYVINEVNDAIKKINQS